MKAIDGASFTMDPNDDTYQIGIGARMIVSSTAQNKLSQANGSLMRCTPLAVFGRKLSDMDLAEASKLDSSLTHPHSNCTTAVACYTCSIAELINCADADSPASSRERERAFERACAMSSLIGNDDVEGWLQMAKEGPLPRDMSGETMGWVARAFINAFWHLLHTEHYSGALESTLLAGGDTDTNAAIAGGLLGAAGGIEYLK